MQLRQVAETYGVPFITDEIVGNPFVVGASAYVLHEIAHRGLPQSAQETGASFLHALTQALSAMDLGISVEGSGLLIRVGVGGVKKPIPAQKMQTLQKGIYSAGALVGITGQRLRINPPLCFAAADIDKACGAIVQGLAEIEGEA